MVECIQELQSDFANQSDPTFALDPELVADRLKQLLGQVELIKSAKTKDHNADVDSHITLSVSLLFDLYSGDPIQALLKLLTKHIQTQHARFTGADFQNPQEISTPMIEAVDLFMTEIQEMQTNFKLIEKDNIIAKTLKQSEMELQR